MFVIRANAGQRTPKACLKIAVDLVEENILNESEALLHFNPTNFVLPLRAAIIPESEVEAGEVIGCGMVNNQSRSGSAYGYVTFTYDQVIRNSHSGKPSIFAISDSEIRRWDTHDPNQFMAETLKLVSGVLIEGSAFGSTVVAIAEGLNICAISDPHYFGYMHFDLGREEIVFHKNKDIYTDSQKIYRSRQPIPLP